MIKFDCHMHTPLCGHSIGEPREFVDFAAQSKLDTITFTCHIPMDQEGFGQKGIRMKINEFSEYKEMIEDAKAYAKDTYDIEVLFGIESEIFPEEKELSEMHAFIQKHPFDFVIGSLHHMLPMYRNWLATNGRHSDDQIISSYFEHLTNAARSGLYDSIGHPDVIRIYGTLKERFDPMAHAEVIHDFLDVVAQSNTCLEINTSGMTKGDFVAHPDPSILKWAIERGVDFTFGSDSHRPETLSQYFFQMEATVKALGLKDVCLFRNREKIRYSI